MAGLHSGSKGKRGEREIVRLARQHGLQAERTWSLAQSSNPVERRCDVLIHCGNGEGLPVQVKLRQDGLSPLYEALDGVKVAFVRSNRRGWLAVLRADDFLKLLAGQRKD